MSVFSYLFQYGKEDFASEIHEINFITTFAVVIIDAINYLTIGIEHSAAIATQYKRLHPYGKNFLFRREVARG